MKTLKTISAGLTALSMMFVMSFAQAATLDFYNITNNPGVDGGDLSSQLSVDYADTGTGVSFTFTNNVGTASSITDIYFDTGFENDLFSAISITNQTAGVSFDIDPKPGNLPSGFGYDPIFISDFGGDSTQKDIDDDDVKTNGVAANGVSAAGESITMLLLYGNKDVAGNKFVYDDFLADLMNGTFRIGMHMQAIGTSGQSDSYINNPPSAVPVPAAAWLFGTALLGFFAAGRRKKIS